MRSERRGELHRHVALVATERDATPSRPAPTPAASGFSLLRLSVPARLLHRCGRLGAALGRRAVGLGVTMPNRTAGHHLPRSDARLRPASRRASHHRRGEARRAARHRRAQRRRQVDPAQGHHRRAQAAQRQHRSRRPQEVRHRLSAAADRDRPQLPDLGVRLRGDGAVARDRRLARPRRHARSDEVARALATVGLRRSRGTARSARLSGGQFQRVLFARLLLQDAALILLDEPFRAIDTKTVADLIALILRWHGEGRTVIAVLHDLEQVRAHFPDDAAAGARAGGLGRDAQSADAGESRQVAAAGRGLRRARRGLRAGREPRASGSRHDRRGHQPFIEFGFMRRALVGCLALSLGAPPIGVFLMLRRMSLMGDALSHAILPGAALGFLLGGPVAAGHESRRLRRRARGGAGRGRSSPAPPCCARMRASPPSISCRWRSAC